jgi:hypothetical protein
MPWVHCTARNCVYNADGACTLRDLSVGPGTAAASQCSVYTPRDHTRIFCELRDCRFNGRGLCGRETVTVALASTDGQETVCADYSPLRGATREGRALLIVDR